MRKSLQKKKTSKKTEPDHFKSAPTHLRSSQQSVLAPVEELTPEGILTLQRTVGNRTVTVMLTQTATEMVQRMVKGSKKFKKKFKEAEKVLNASKTGKEALVIVAQYKIDVKEGTAGGGSEYSASSNAMKIDPKETAVEVALTFVHEVNHAKAYHEGKWADPKKLSREDYIKAEIKEEADGTVKSIETKIELEGTKIDVSKASFPLERQYRKAYKAAVDQAKATDARKRRSELKRIGRKAGRARVIKGFYDGEVIISTSKAPVTYPDYYGKIWDKKNKKKK
jgi:hypothetical protein